MEDHMSRHVVVRLLLVACAAAFVMLPTAVAFGSNNGDVWVDNVGQPAGSGHEMDPHLACQDINLWGSDLANSSGSYTIDGWPPSGSQEQVYASTWSYDQAAGGSQVLDVISVSKLIETAIANGDAPQNGQGFHFKLEFSQNPQLHKTFWVNCQVPTIATNASSAVAGQQIHDTATLSGGSSPTGTITWNVYNSSDTSCSNSLGSVSDSVNGDGTYVSPSFSPPSAGSYQWVATYSGDSGNFTVSTKCNDPNEQSTVSKASPSIVTSASSGTVGQPVHDVATLSGGDSPTGTITWKVYAANTGCATALATVTASVDGDGTYISPDFTPSSAGTYQWVATYSGDANNNSVASACNDTGEQSTVSKASPSIATTATSNTSGGAVHDVATLSGGDSPTGTITWNVYAAGTGCATSLHTVSVPVSGDGVYTSPDYTPSSTGTYQWVAMYSGDSNNNAVSSACDDTNEQSTISATPAPAIALVKLERNGSSGPYVHGPITGNVGDTINYQMTVTNTGNTNLVITFSDPHCDAGTLSAPVVVSGTYDSATNTLSPGGELQYTCSHKLTASDAPEFSNTASVSGQPPSGPPVTASDTVVATLNLPGMSVVKLQRDGSSGAFTTSTIPASVGDTIQYEIQVTNTGNTPLALSLSDPHCDSGTIAGPFPVSGTLAGNVLSPGGTAQFKCSHVLGMGDEPSFTNVGTVTGQPPSGPPLTGSGSVTVTVTHPGISVVKLQRDGSSGTFTSSPITAKIGDTIEYEIQVTNTGTAPLTLSLSDPRCDAGTIAGPVALSGTLVGNVLSPGGVAQYTCSHVLKRSDASPFTNTATVTGTPPVGPPVSGTSSVQANKQGVKSVKVVRCGRHKVKKHKKVHGKTVTVCVKKKKVRAVVIRRTLPSFTG